MKNLLIILFLFTGLQTFSQTDNFYDLKAKTIDGKEFDFESLKGKRVMIVNVASKCGYTSQYKDLQELHEKYGSNDFVIIAFPANNFLKQEPGSDSEIKQFCSSKYNVSFQMMSKISVKGNDIHQVYKWLCEKKFNKRDDFSVKWNFQKFFIDENGQHVGKVNPSVNPMDKQIVKWAKGEIKAAFYK